MILKKGENESSQKMNVVDSIIRLEKYILEDIKHRRNNDAST